MSAPLKPINKRWPGKYAFRVKCYLPTGAMIEYETWLPDALAKDLLDTLKNSLLGKYEEKKP